MKATLLLGFALLLATSPAFAQTTFYNPDGSVAPYGTDLTHVRRGKIQYSYDRSGKVVVRIHMLGNVAKLYDAQGYLGTAVAGPNGTTVRFRSGNRVWTPTIKDFR